MAIFLIVLAVLAIAGACVAILTPPPHEDRPHAIYTAAKGNRSAELALFLDRHYKLNFKIDGVMDPTITGSWWTEGELDGEASLLFLTDDDGPERKLVFQKGLLTALSEDLRVAADYSVMMLEFTKKS